MRAANSVSAYARDIAVFCRFLEQARGGKGIWACDAGDLAAFKRARLHGDPEQAVSVSTWRRSIAALDKWAAWARYEGLIEELPFRYVDKTVWMPNGVQRIRVNTASEPDPGPAPVRFLAFEDYLAWRDAGLAGRLPDGRPDPSWRGRHGERNCLFADLLIFTGMRLGEAASLLAAELPGIRPADGRVPVISLAAVTKRSRARSVFPPAPHPAPSPAAAGAPIPAADAARAAWWPAAHPARRRQPLAGPPHAAQPPATYHSARQKTASFRCWIRTFYACGCQHCAIPSELGFPSPPLSCGGRTTVQSRPLSRRMSSIPGRNLSPGASSVRDAQAEPVPANTPGRSQIPVAAAAPSAAAGERPVARRKTKARSEEPDAAVPLEPRQVWLDRQNDLWLSECEYANVRRGGRKVISRSSVVRLALDRLREAMTHSRSPELLAGREPVQTGRGRPRR